MHCWNVAQKDSALRYSLNTRMTHEAAYNRYRHELENIGIDSVSAFRRIINSTQSLESAQRKTQEEPFATSTTCLSDLTHLIVQLPTKNLRI